MLANYNQQHEFKHIYLLDHIDFWGGVEIAETEEQNYVLAQMPEPPKDGIVYRVLFPYSPGFVHMYLCKANRNEVVYMFSDVDISDMINEIVEF